MSALIQESPTLNAQFGKAPTPADMLSLIRSFGGTFTRGSEPIDPDVNSPKTYVDSLGAIRIVKSGYPAPNFVDGVNKGVLPEEQRTNLLLRSEEFDNAVWLKGNVSITANNSNAPDGNLTADLLVSTVDTSTDHRVRQNPGMAVSTAYTASAFIKKTDVRYFYIRDLTNNIHCIFDTDTGTVTFQSSGMVAGIKSLANGWFKVTATFTTPASITNNLVDYGITSSSTNFSSTLGIGDSGLIWGAQLEAGSLTSYIPTAGTTVTRGAETGVTVTDAPIPPTEGVVLVSCNINTATYTTERTIFSLSNGTTTESIRLATTAGGALQFRLAVGGVGSNVVFLSAGNFPTGDVTFCARYKSGDWALYANGDLLGTSSSTSFPATPTRFDIGKFVTTNIFNGTFKQGVVIPNLTNAQLQLLSRL